MDNSLLNKYTIHLNNIKEVNEFIIGVVKYLKNSYFNIFDDTLSNNLKACDIYKELNDNPNQLASLDKFLHFCAYEFCPYDSSINSFKLYYKYEFLTNNINKGVITNVDESTNFNKLFKIVNFYFKKISNYYNEPYSAIILTAVPIEFISILRKFAYFIETSDIKELKRLLNPDISIEDKKNNRKKIWVSGVIERNNKWVKVKILLLDNYGSVSASNYLSSLNVGINFPDEILLIGVAGHLDKNNKVKIGHLVISNGFYNAYSQKIENKGISYKDKKVKYLSDDYNSSTFNWDQWIPYNQLIKCPNINNKDKESCIQKVHKGFFVSLHAVNKQTYSKNKLQENFTNSLAVEMEATGCYEFIKDKPYIKLKIIKAVVDWSDETKNYAWQPYGADLAAEFAVDYLIAKYGQTIK